MKYLLGLLIGLDILDGLLTYFLVRNGLGREANPFLRAIVAGDNFLLFKVSGGILAVFLLWVIYTRWPKVAIVCASLFLALYVVIVVWNVSLFLA